MMVDNFLPAFDMTEELRVDKRVDEQLSRIQADLEAKRSMVQKAGLQDKAAHEMYRAYVKNQPETVWAAFQITDDCIGCGICTRVCPAGCIYLEDQKAIHTMEGCQACYACVHACPKASIQFTLSQPEKNPTARYRNPHIALSELIVANNQKED
jgi:ferredoxin